jgi:DNA-binding NarL/FixJ family response regulator
VSAVVIVQSHDGWPSELLGAIARQGHVVLSIDDVRLVPFFILAGGVAAVMVDLRGLQLLGALTLRRCREVSPSTAIVAVAVDASAPTLTRALESGATAFLSWPASAEVVGRALGSTG